MTFEQLVNKYKIQFSCEFIPYSQSRNVGKWESLNWLVDINGISFDYSAGTAHCPKPKPNKLSLGMKRNKVLSEIEVGKVVTRFYHRGMRPCEWGKAIEPNYQDVLHSLVLDSQVFDFGSFAEWACNYGYSSDSIEAKGIYESCLSHALQLRATFGESFFADAAIVYEDS